MQARTADVQTTVNPNGALIADGTKIHESPGSGFCTAGWWAVDGAGNNYLLIAGHCIVEAGVTATWSDDEGNTIGSAANWSYGGSVPAGHQVRDYTDWGALAITGGNVQPTAIVATDPGFDNIDAVSGAWPYTPVGGTVCFSGAVSGQQCGPIISYNTATAQEAATLPVVEAHICSNHGDSGSPVYQVDPSHPGGVNSQGVNEPGFVIPQGILVGVAGDCTTTYTPISTVLSDADLTLVSSEAAPTVSGSGFPSGAAAMIQDKFGAGGMCLDSNASGNVYANTCNTGDYQNWAWANGEDSNGLETASPGTGSPLVNQQTGLCLDSNASRSVYAGKCNGGGFQNWTYDTTTGVFQDVQTQLCLDASTGSAGASISTVSCGATPSPWITWMTVNSTSTGDYGAAQGGSSPIASSLAWRAVVTGAR